MTSAGAHVGAIPDAAGGAARRRVHPLVFLDYRIRIPANALVALIIGTVFWERGLPPAWYAFLLVYGFVWPHLAFLNGKYGRNTKDAELTNLLVDAFVNGALRSTPRTSPHACARRPNPARSS